MIIPTLNPTAINQPDLDLLMEIGFCYVKIPHLKLRQNMLHCLEVAREFFQTSKENKQKYHVQDTIAAGELYQGYAMRSQSSNTNSIEQFFFEPNAPYGPYKPYSAIIEEINDHFTKFIYFPIVSAIFNRAGLNQANFLEATEDPNCSLVFNCYPPVSSDRKQVRFNEHKDFGLLTVLFFEEAGLEVQYCGQWQPIPAKEDCLVVNLGNALELMTAKRCHSALHRVINTTDNRASMVYFYNPNYQQKVRNYVDNELIATTGEEFFKDQFLEYYQVNS